MGNYLPIFRRTNCEANAVPGNVIGGTRETCSKNKNFWYQCHGRGSGDPRHEHYSRAGLNVRHCPRNDSKKTGDHNFCDSGIER